MGKWAAAALCIVAAGCAADDGPKQGPPLESTSPIVGDWFLCDAPDCSTLKNHGVTWATNGRWVLLLVRNAQSLTPTGTYCASPYEANNGPFTFDEPTGALTMMDDLGRDAGGGMLTFNAPMLTLERNGSGSLYLKIDPTRSDGKCPLPGM